MKEKRYYWLKLEEDYFDGKIQKALRKLPSGTDMLICYLKMQLKYLKKNGLIEFKGIYDNIYEEVALDIDEDVDLVKMTIALLLKWKTIEDCKNSNLYMSEMQKRIGSKTDTALRVAKHREEQKLLQCNIDVTKCNSIEEKDIELDNSSNSNNNIYEFTEQNFARTLSPIEFEKIDQWKQDYNEDIIKYAIELTILNNKKSFSYTEGILRNWKSNGYKTLDEIKQNETRKEDKPLPQIEDYNWLDGE